MSFNFLGLPKVSIAWIVKEMLPVRYKCQKGVVRCVKKKCFY